MSALLEVREVSKVYSGRLVKRQHTVALDRLTLAVPDDRATVLTIAGESGSGKTTLAGLLLGHLKPTAGEILYRGQQLGRMTGAERRRFRREVQPVLQDPFAAFNPFYRIDHVLNTPIRRFRLARGSRQRNALIEAALDNVGLRPQDTLGRFPHQLSGGQRQRVMIARALLCRPRVILADEPVAMVDASLRATILTSIQHLRREFGIAVIYITHDLTTAYQISDNVIVLYKGTVAEAGSINRVIGDPQHPYTRLLVSSIPLPDPRRRWGEEAERDTKPDDETTSGCPFAPRCPSATERCTTLPPPRYQIDPDRLASCFLHEHHPVVAGDDVSAVLTAVDTVDVRRRDVADATSESSACP